MLTALPILNYRRNSQNTVKAAGNLNLHRMIWTFNFSSLEAVGTGKLIIICKNLAAIRHKRIFIYS